MTLAVGIDLVDVGDVRSALSEHGSRYLGRIYTPREVAESTTGSAVDPRRLAARFAAKEAVMKTLAPAPGDAVPWAQIGVHQPAAAAPWVQLTGAAQALARRRGIEELALSISSERERAAAVAVARGREPQ